MNLHIFKKHRIDKAERILLDLFDDMECYQIENSHRDLLFYNGDELILEYSKSGEFIYYSTIIFDKIWYLTTDVDTAVVSILERLYNIKIQHTFSYQLPYIPKPNSQNIINSVKI